MKPIVYTLFAVFFYAVSNTILELKLAKYHAFTTLSVVGGVLCVTMFFLRLFFVGADDPTRPYPVGDALLILLVAAVVWMLGDSFFVSAYTSGGDVLTVTSIIIFFPLVSAGMKLAAVGKYPNMLMMVAAVILMCGAVVMAKGIADLSAGATVTPATPAPAT